MISPTEKLISKLWDKCFDLYIQMQAQAVYLAITDGKDLQTARGIYSDISLMSSYFPKNKSIPQHHLNDFYKKYEEEVNQIIKSRDSKEDINHAMAYTYGVQDAYKYALEVNADEAKIQEDLSYQNEILKFEVENNYPDAQPGTETRIYSDAYREGLQHILDIIRQKNSA